MPWFSYRCGKCGQLGPGGRRPAPFPPPAKACKKCGASAWRSVEDPDSTGGYVATGRLGRKGKRMGKRAPGSFGSSQR